jgi:hypothetical protein
MLICSAGGAVALAPRCQVRVRAQEAAAAALRSAIRTDVVNIGPGRSNYFMQGLDLITGEVRFTKMGTHLRGADEKWGSIEYCVPSTSKLSDAERAATPFAQGASFAAASARKYWHFEFAHPIMIRDPCHLQRDCDASRRSCSNLESVH